MGETSRGRRPRGERPRDPAAVARIQQQATWVDLQLRKAMERGDFDQLPGYGKPLELTEHHDPDWWVKQLVERENVTVLPPSLQLRREDAELDDRLDRLTRPGEVRREVEEFNARVRWALYRPPEGPPVVTRQRDPDDEVERWEARRAERRSARQTAPSEADPETGPRRRFRWRRRKRDQTSS